MPAGPLKPDEEPHVFEAAVELENGVDSLESLAFVLGRLIQELFADLVR
jgi:hypothetical protein